MKFRKSCFVAIAFLLAAGVACAQTANIDFGTNYQTIRGFGASEAWSWTMSSSQIQTLYGMGSGQMGLTIMRLRIAPTTWTSSSQTADTSAWYGEVSNGLAAQKLGAIVFASPWSAPASMKSDNSTNEGSLNTSSYADYAAYLEAYVNYASSQGVNLYAISMQNEPDWNPCDPAGTDEGPNGADCYESMLWTASEMDTWVAQNSSVLTTKLIMPESFCFRSNMSDTALDDSNAVDKISIVGGHLYCTSPYYYTNAKNKGKDVWMTEHYIGLLSGESSNDNTTIGDAMTMAKELHNSMAVAQYNAYVYWWPTSNGGLVDSNYNLTYPGYAMEHYAKFIRPGYQMVSATNNPTSGVYITAYQGNGNQVIVAINDNTGSVSQSFSIANQTITSLTPYQTTSSSSVAQQNAVTVSNNAFTYSLPAQSITTFVGSGTCAPTAITPYIYVNSAWVQESSATVTSTSATVNLGPQPISGGSWSWSGPNSFTSTSREIDGIKLSAGTNTYTATYTNASGCKSTQAFTITVATPTAITPYMQVNGGAWTVESSATVTSTSATVNLGPQPITGGTWSWTGPNSFTSTSREIDNIKLSAGTNTYTATYTNSYNMQSTQAFTITVTPTNTAAVLTTPTPSSTLTSSSATFSWSTGTGVSNYKLTLGATAGGSDVYNSYTTTANSKTVSGIPTNGGTLYATLWSQIGGVWSSNAYTYTEASVSGKAVLSTPTPGSALTGSSATFTWSKGTNVTAYKLTLGTTAGGSDVYNSYTTTANSKGVSGIPTNGKTLYATLYSEISGVWSSNSYTYTEK